MSTVKLSIDKGATFRFPFLWHDGQGNSHIPTARFRCHFRESIQSEQVLLELTTENGGFPTGSHQGQPCAFLYISDLATSRFPADRAVFDVEGILPSGDVTRLFQGTAVFTAEITR